MTPDNLTARKVSLLTTLLFILFLNNKGVVTKIALGPSFVCIPVFCNETVVIVKKIDIEEFG